MMSLTGRVLAPSLDGLALRRLRWLLVSELAFFFEWSFSCIFRHVSRDNLDFVHGYCQGVLAWEGAHGKPLLCPLPFGFS